MEVNLSESEKSTIAAMKANRNTIVDSGNTEPVVTPVVEPIVAETTPAVEPKKDEPAPIVAGTTPTKTDTPVVVATTPVVVDNTPDYLKDDEQVAAPVNTPEATEEKYKPYVAKANEYDTIQKDPLINAILEWRKSGGQDITEFVSTVGATDVSKLSIETLLTNQAKSLGFDGEELTQAVTEQMEKHEGMTLMEKRTFEKNLREQYSKGNENKLVGFTTHVAEQRKATEQIENKTYEQINSKIESMVGKPFFGMQIDKTMADEIKKLAPLYSTPIRDEKGNLSGFDIESGVELAILKRYTKALLKTNYNLGKSAGQEEQLKDRIRPSENLLRHGNTVYNADPSERQERVNKAIEREKNDTLRKMGKLVAN